MKKKSNVKLHDEERKLHRREEKEHAKQEKAESEDKMLHRKIDALHKKMDGLHKMHHDSMKKGSSKKVGKKEKKIEKVMHEFKEGKLHSGSKKGPEVKNPKQAIAIALSEARRAKKK